MNPLAYLKAATRALPALPGISPSTNALTARLTGLNRWGLTGFLAYESGPAENQQLLKDGYTDNHIVYTVTDWKASQLAKAPPLVYEIKDQKSYFRYKHLSAYQKANEYTLRQKSIQEIDDVDDRMVKTLRNPNPAQTWSELAYAISVYYDLQGNALIYGVGPDAGQNAGQFHQLYVLPTALYAGRDPGVEGYQFFVDTLGINSPIPGNQVLHLRRFSASLEGEGGGLWGMSRLAPARRVLTKSTQAQEAEAELFLNRGARTIVFPKYYQGQEPVTGEQARMAGDAIRRKLSQAGSGGIATNSVELGAIQLSMNSDDLKLMESNALSEKQLCALFHVDSIAVFSAVTDASRANGETAVRKSLIEGVLPDQAIIAQKLNQWFTPAYNRANKYERYIEFNTDVYPQLQTDKKEMMAYLAEVPLTGDELREVAGYEAVGSPEMQVPLFPQTRVPLPELFGANDPPKNDGTY